MLSNKSKLIRIAVHHPEIVGFFYILYVEIHIFPLSFQTSKNIILH